MNKLFTVGLGLAFSLGMIQAQAESSIEGFIGNGTATSNYFNCAYKLKIASKKCLVTTSRVESSIDYRAKKVFGSNKDLPLLTIKWPDGDRSRYLDIGGDKFYKLINLEDRKDYNYRTIRNDAESLDYTKGLVIEDQNFKEHIRLW